MVAMIEGIDCSSWQGAINWRAAKAKGVKFAFIKATEGSTYMNPNFPRDWKEARRVGIVRGAYHYFDPSQSVTSQVNHFVAVVGYLESGDLPPALDLEGNKWNAIPVEDRLPLALAWLEAVERAFGLPPIVYVGYYFARDVLRTAGALQLKHHQLWIPNYNKRLEKPPVPSPWLNWTFWQYTDSAQIPSAINGRVDKNRFAGSAEDLLQLTKPNSNPPI